VETKPRDAVQRFGKFPASVAVIAIQDRAHETPWRMDNDACAQYQ
jgi:hypothetical protein